MRAGVLKEEQDLNRPRLGVGVDGTGPINASGTVGRISALLERQAPVGQKELVSAMAVRRYFGGPNESLRKESQK